MEFEDVLKFLKTRDETNFKFTKHFYLRSFKRGISKENIVECVLNQEIVGMQNQEDNVYKITFMYNSIEDLSIVLKVKNEDLIIITMFAELKTRRLKNEKR